MPSWGSSRPLESSNFRPCLQPPSTYASSHSFCAIYTSSRLHSIRHRTSLPWLSDAALVNPQCRSRAFWVDTPKSCSHSHMSRTGSVSNRPPAYRSHSARDSPHTSNHGIAVPTTAVHASYRLQATQDMAPACPGFSCCSVILRGVRGGPCRATPVRRPAFTGPWVESPGTPRARC